MKTPLPGHSVWAPLVMMMAGFAAGCGGGEEIPDAPSGEPAPTYRTNEEGQLVSEFDIDQDGQVDVRKYLEEYPDPDDPSIIKTRMVKKEVDVNSDGSVNIRRYYNEYNDLAKEEVDTDLDGRFDAVNFHDAGRLVRKEILDPDTGRVIAFRYYEDGTIARVEKDESGDEKIDYWEFYEQGVLDRIGRDVDGDGRADTWQTR